MHSKNSVLHTRLAHVRRAAWKSFRARIKHIARTPSQASPWQNAHHRRWTYALAERVPPPLDIRPDRTRTTRAECAPLSQDAQHPRRVRTTLAGRAAPAPSAHHSRRTRSTCAECAPLSPNAHHPHGVRTTLAGRAPHAPGTHHTLAGRYTSKFFLRSFQQIVETSRAK